MKQFVDGADYDISRAHNHHSQNGIGEVFFGTVGRAAIGISHGNNILNASDNKTDHGQQQKDSNQPIQQIGQQRGNRDI